MISLFVMLAISFGSLFATISAGWSPKLGLDLAGGAEVVLTPAAGRTISASQLAVTETIEEAYEPYLIRQGLLHRTPRGRVATDRAFEHLGVPRGNGRLL